MLRQFGPSNWTTVHWTVIRFDGPLDRLYYGNLHGLKLQLWNIQKYGCGPQFGASKIPYVDRNFGPYKIMVWDQNFRPSNVTVWDRNFEPFKIMVGDRNFKLSHKFEKQ